MATIELGENVALISDFAFCDCSSLSNVKFNDKLETIGKNAFCRDTSLKEVVFGSNLKAIEYEAFYRCTGLENVVLNNGLKTIGVRAFAYNGNGLLGGSSNLQSLVILASVEYVGARVASPFLAFSHNTTITSYCAGDTTKWDANWNQYCTNPVYYYSETEPALNADGTAYDGYYWHYVNGVATPWVKEN